MDFSFEQFEKAYKEYMISNPIRRIDFTFYFHVNFPFEESFDFLGKRVNVFYGDIAIKNDFIKKAIEWNERNHLLSEDFFQDRTNKGYRLISVTINTYSLEKAYIDFEELLYNLKGIIEYYRGKGVFFYNYGAINKINFSYFNLPEFFIVDFNNQSLFYWITTKLKDVDIAINLMESNQFEIMSNIDKFKDIPNKGSIFSLLLSTFQLYGKAVSSEFRASAFQFFWNILEIVTLSGNNNGSTSYVIKKLKAFYKDEYLEMYERSINEIGDIRNKLVHEGIDKVNQLHLNFIKSLVEGCIKILLSNINRVNTIAKLEVCFRVRSLPIKLLKEEVEILQDIIEKRKTNDNAPTITGEQNKK
jgi:hypothetical protein